MIARRPASPAAVALAADVGADAVTLFEAPAVAGARSSLTVAYRIQRAAPRRSSRVTVLPYHDPAWIESVAEWLRVEEACFAAWWTWAGGDLGRDANGVWRVPPLVEPINAAIRRFDVVDDGRTLPAFQRPWLDWPDVGSATLSDDRVRNLWAQLRDVLTEHVGPQAGVVFELPDDPYQRLDLRRRLLTDGRTLVPSSFRPFLRAFSHLDEARPRVAG